MFSNLWRMTTTTTTEHGYEHSRHARANGERFALDSILALGWSSRAGGTAVREQAVAICGSSVCVNREWVCFLLCVVPVVIARRQQRRACLCVWRVSVCACVFVCVSVCAGVCTSPTQTCGRAGVRRPTTALQWNLPLAGIMRFNRGLAKMFHFGRCQNVLWL